MNRWLKTSGPMAAVWLLSSVALAQAPAPAQPTTPAAPPVAKAPAASSPAEASAPVAPPVVAASKKVTAKGTIEKKANKKVAADKKAVAVKPSGSQAPVSPPETPKPAAGLPAVATSAPETTGPKSTPSQKLAPFPGPLAPLPVLPAAAVSPVPVTKALAAAGPSAVAEPADNSPKASKVAKSTRPEIRGWLGMSTSIVDVQAYDVFSEDDALSMTALGLAWAPSWLSSAGLAIVGTLDAGRTRSELRGESTKLSSLRMGLGFELGSALLDFLDYSVRFAGVAHRLSAELDESSSGVLLSERKWSPGLEANFGLVFKVAKIQTKTPNRPVEVFLRAEGGYLWLPSTDLALGSDSDNAPVRLEPFRVNNLDLGGDHFRLAVGVGF